MKLRSLAAFLVVPATLAGAQPAMQEQAGVRWVCGGVGADERAALAALEREANLKLMFVTEKRGGYLADVAVAMYDAKASTPRLQLTSDGPICLLRAPAGRYRIEAAYGKAKRSATAAPDKDAGKPARVVFSFPGEPWDGIRASEADKEQARTR
jgi:hypothetical protein